MSRHIFQRVEQNTGHGESNKVTNHVYSNILISNNTNDLIRAEYVVNQTQPILSHQEDFQLRLVRFKIPMSAVPMFIFEPERYYLSLAIATEVFVPTPGGLPVPQETHTDVLPALEVPFYPQLTPYESAKASEPAYRNGVYHINDFLRGVNRVLRVLWDQVKADPAYVDIINEITLQDNEYPKLNFSTSQNRFFFELPLRREAPDDLYSTMFFPGRHDNFPEGNRPSIRILMSSDLYSLFNGFPAYDFGPQGVNRSEPNLNYGLSLHFNRDQCCNCVNRYYNEGVNAVPGADEQLPYPYQCVYQEQTSVYAWQHASRLLISSSMGFVKETLVSNERNTSGTPDSFEVLTDFALQQDSNTSSREYIYYNDQGGMRYIDTKATGQLNRVDVRILVEFDNGSRIPLYIKPHHEVNLKLAFDRKPHNDIVQISDTQRHTFEN